MLSVQLPTGQVLRQKLVNGGNTPRYESLEQFKATIHKDRATWAAVVKESGATID